jgi:alkyldihydroxyacetonephosphate synthase
MWPANLRMLDPAEAQDFAGLDGEKALLIIGFESAELPQDDNIRQAVAIARDAGGSINEDNIVIADAAQRSDASAGRQGAVGNWRNSFINAPYERNVTVGFGVVAETLETSITWDRWPQMDAAVRSALHDALQNTCGNGRVSCRFTHVYPDGPAPYYTFEALGKVGGELEAHAAIKQAASDAVMAAGGTITHHHAVGRTHRPWYDRQRPDPFADALRAAKRSLDPHGILNPGVLIDP